MAACFTQSAVCPVPAPLLVQRRPARVSICCSLGFLKKKAEPSTPSRGSEALAWAKDVTPIFTIVGTVASLVVAWNTVVLQPNKAQFEDQQKQMQELRKDQQKQLELLTRMEQLLSS